MKRSVLVACLLPGVFASGAFAADVSVYGNLDDSVQASNNYFLSNAPSGYTLNSSNKIDLNVLAATPTTRYLLNSDYSYNRYFGPGAKDTTLTFSAPISEKFTIDHTHGLSKYNLEASWIRSDAATTSLQQTGTATGTGSVDTYKINAGVTRELTHIDSVSWSANASTVSFSDPDQTPYIDYGSTGSWNHRLSATTTLTNSVSTDWLIVANPANTQRLFWNATTGLQSTLSSRLTFNGSVGAVFVNAYQDHQVPVNFFGFTFYQIQPQLKATQDWTGNIGLNYQLFNSTKVSFNATRSITPTVFGQLLHVQSIGTSLGHDINYFSSLTFSAQLSHLTSFEPGSGPSADAIDSDVFTASANYEYKLTRDWRTNLSYTYNQRNDQSGLVRSSTVLLRLSRDFTLFGKPKAVVQKTPSELAQEDQTRAQQALPYLIP